MKIKRIKKIKINSWEFKIEWNKKACGSYFDYNERIISIGIKNLTENAIFGRICHEIMEIVAIEMNVRLHRPDCDSDYLFVYDHRQHDTMMYMFSGAIREFLE